MRSVEGQITRYNGLPTITNRVVNGNVGMEVNDRIWAPMVVSVWERVIEVIEGGLDNYYEHN